MKVSIVAAYNSKIEMTVDFMDNLQEQLKNWSNDELEVILVNGGNEFDITHPFVTKFIKTDRKDTTGVYNLGLKAVSEDSDFVCLMGNDSFPNNHSWLANLKRAYFRSGAVIACPENTRPGREAYRHLYLKEDEDYFYCNMFPSIIWFFSTKLLTEIGYFDEGYVRTGMYNDDDYCERIRRKYGNNTIHVLKGLVIPHLCGQESGSTGTVNQDMQDNYKYFKEKFK